MFYCLYLFLYADTSKECSTETSTQEPEPTTSDQDSSSGNSSLKSMFPTTMQKCTSICLIDRPYSSFIVSYRVAACIGDVQRSSKADISH